MLVELERLGIKTVGLSDECTGRDGASQPLVSMNPATDALVTIYLAHPGVRYRLIGVDRRDDPHTREITGQLEGA